MKLFQERKRERETERENKQKINETDNLQFAIIRTVTNAGQYLPNTSKPMRC